MSEKKDNNLIEINKKNLTEKKLNDKNVEESKEVNEETTENLLSTDLINQINLNYEDENSDNINFNINPFNNNEKELTDNDSNSSDNDLMFVENDIQNNFNPEKIDLKEYLKQQSLQTDNNNNNDNLNYFEENKEKGKKNVYSQMQTTFNLNNNKPIPRVPSNPIPASYLGNFNINNNIENSLNAFDFYQNNYSHSNSNLNLGNIMFPNNSFSMNGKYGWICSNCENFNYESKILFNIYSENSM
jgi:hypothetical protein